MKSAKDYLAEANAVVPRISAEDALKHHGATGALFVDVRDSAAIAKTGTIKGAVRIPRGFMEFSADETSPYDKVVNIGGFGDWEKAGGPTES